MGCRVPAQVDGPVLRVEGAGAAFAGLLADGTRGLQAVGVHDAEGRAHALLGCLRLGQLGAARRLLEEEPTGGDRWAACWAVISHHWYLRATHDVATIAPRLARLQGGLAATTQAPGPPATFAEAALLPHALFCLGSMLPSCGQQQAGAECTRRAVEAWLELERQTWQPGRGHYRARPTHGEIRLPEPPEPSVLAPAAAGMLVATGDRLPRHLEASLPVLLAQPPTGIRDAAWVLGGAVQRGDRRQIDTAWNALLAVATARVGGSAGDAGRGLDAMLFAVTGLRLATGAGVDEHGTRWRPHLPPGHRQLALHGIVADGARFDLDIRARCGALHDDEHRDASLLDHPTGSRLRVAITLTHAGDDAPRTIVLQGSGLQYLARLHVGERLQRSLPIDEP
jgi:hypothetical protein